MSEADSPTIPGMGMGSAAPNHQPSIKRNGSTSRSKDGTDGMISTSPRNLSRVRSQTKESSSHSARSSGSKDKEKKRSTSRKGPTDQSSQSSGTRGSPIETDMLVSSTLPASSPLRRDHTELKAPSPRQRKSSIPRSESTDPPRLLPLQNPPSTSLPNIPSVSRRKSSLAALPTNDEPRSPSRMPIDKARDETRPKSRGSPSKDSSKSKLPRERRSEKPRTTPVPISTIEGRDVVTPTNLSAEHDDDHSLQPSPLNAPISSSSASTSHKVSSRSVEKLTAAQSPALSSTPRRKTTDRQASKSSTVKESARDAVTTSSFYLRPQPHLPSAKVKPSTPSSLYWSRTPVFGQMPGRNLRAHSATLVTESSGVGGKIWVFGGCDANTCWKDLWLLDAETFLWTKPRPSGNLPPPCRAHSATLADGRIWIFGGGDGPTYFNTVYYFDTVSHTWVKPKCEGVVPSKRRAHTTVLWRDKLVVFGGGDGIKALSDVYCLSLYLGGDGPQMDDSGDDSASIKPSWSEMTTHGIPPKNRGYHTANLINDKLVIFGGSDGHACFGDVHILDLSTQTWQELNIIESIPRLSHTSTQIGSYLFIFGGHDGKDYSNNILLFNLVNLDWETREVAGLSPVARGYHATILYDSRVILIGGFNGKQVFDDVHTLDLGSASYLPQITSFPFAC